MTPRAGRPVELNALWYNATAHRRRSGRAVRTGRPGRLNCKHLPARSTSPSTARFWNEMTGCCFDVRGGTWSGSGDPPQPGAGDVAAVPGAAKPTAGSAVLELCGANLLTPFGLRTLSPRTRDMSADTRETSSSAIGPITTARSFRGCWGRSFPPLRLAAAMRRDRCPERCCCGPVSMHAHRGAGTHRELFDGDAPHAPGGAIASAAATGELLRCYAEEVLELRPDVSTRIASRPLKHMTPRTVTDNKSRPEGLTRLEAACMRTFCTAGAKCGEWPSQFPAGRCERQPRDLVSR